MTRVLFVLCILATGCALSYEELDRTNAVCSKVTDQNWRMAAWGNRSSYDVCRGTPAVHNEDFIPCTLGARPFFCKQGAGGHVLVYSQGGTYIDDIFHEDMERVAPHLVLIR